MAKHKKSSSQHPSKTNSFWQQHFWAILCIGLFSMVLYAPTVSYDYALDDQIVILSNQYTKQGFSGIGKLLSTESMEGFWGEQKNLLAGGRYRPLSIVTFAVEWELFGQNPMIGHLINILLYVLTNLLLYRILVALFAAKTKRKSKTRYWFLTIPFITTLLFVAHPLHTEVVANIKGRDEIMTFLGALAALYFSLQYVKRERITDLIWSGLCLFLALLSKENAITFVGIIPLTLYFFTKSPLRQIGKTTLPLIAATVVFLVIRWRVIGYFFNSGTEVTELLNDPFLNASFAQKYATIFSTMGYYLKLLVFPHPLTHDYYPKEFPIIGWADWRAIAPLVIYTLLGLFALWGLKRKSISAFGVWFYLLSFSIVSNLFFAVGTFINERFMYISLLGFCLIVAYGLVRYLPQLLPNVAAKKYVIGGIVGALLLAYSFQTLRRLPAWENNTTLFLTDVKISTNSTKVNTSAGGTIYERAITLQDVGEKQKLLYQAIKYLTKAVEIHPQNTSALLLLGNAFYALDQNIDNVFGVYAAIFVNNPDHADATKNLMLFSRNIKSPKEADKFIRFYEKYVIPYGVNNATTFAVLGKLYGQYRQDAEKAMKYLEQSIAINPNDASVLQDLGIVYGMADLHEKALKVSLKALELQPNNTQLLQNIGIAYRNLGDAAKAEEYFQRAEQRGGK
ncbi:MAG: tetratricopeptide repeat protein [Chitinophagales bacterium]